MKKQFVQNDNNMAVAYYRFSSHAQNEQSIDRQRELSGGGVRQKRDRLQKKTPFQVFFSESEGI